MVGQKSKRHLFYFTIMVTIALTVLEKGSFNGILYIREDAVFANKRM